MSRATVLIKTPNGCIFCQMGKRWEPLKCFIHREGQSHETVSINHTDCLKGKVSRSGGSNLRQSFRLPADTLTTRPSRLTPGWRRGGGAYIVAYPLQERLAVEALLMPNATLPPTRMMFALRWAAM